MIFFDAHCHLQDERFGSDLSGVFGRAQQAGVHFQAVKGTTEKDWIRVADLAIAHKKCASLLWVASLVFEIQNRTGA